MIMAILAFAIFLLAKAGKFPASYTKSCLVVVLTVILGPGLVVNGILKNCWGRPRPADTISFGGTSPDRNFLNPGGPGAGKSLYAVIAPTRSPYRLEWPFSFSSGHSRIFIRGWIGIRNVRELRKNGSGGHYLSDVVWSGFIVLSIIVWLYFCIFKILAVERE